MAFRDLQFKKVYGDRGKDSRILVTHDIEGAQSRYLHARDRFVRDTQKSLSHGLINDYSIHKERVANVRKGAANLTHIDRMLKNLPGGTSQFERLIQTIK